MFFVQSLLCFFAFATINIYSHGDECENSKKIVEQVSGEKSLFVDLIIFSYHWVLQFFVFLGLIEHHVTGLNQIYVFYSSDNKEFYGAFEQLKKCFPKVRFYQQAKINSHAVFKPMLLYIMFGVDDIIVMRHVNVQVCVQATEKYDAYGFYLRLGKNIIQCYTLGVHEDFRLPSLKEVETAIYSWTLKEGFYDWIFLGCIDLCYEHSMMMNIPLNIVKKNKRDCNMNFWTPEELLEEFNDSFTFDIEKFYEFENKAPHTHYIPIFI